MAPTNKQTKDKHFRLDARKIKLAQAILGASTETETIERALVSVISEHERNRRAWTAHERFLKAAVKGRSSCATSTACWRTDACSPSSSTPQSTLPPCGRATCGCWARATSCPARHSG